MPMDQKFLEKVIDYVHRKRETLVGLSCEDPASRFDEEGDPIDEKGNKIDKYKYIKEATERINKMNKAVDTLDYLGELLEEVPQPTFSIYVKLAESLLDEDYEEADKLKKQLEN